MLNLMRALCLISLAFQSFLLGTTGAASAFFDPNVSVFGTPVDAGKAGAVSRGILLRAGQDEWVVFDQDLLRPVLWFQASGSESPVSLALMSQASWDKPTRKGGVSLPKPPHQGIQLTPALPGVASDLSGLKKDPRPVFGHDPGRGGLEKTARRFLGYTVAGEVGVLTYRCGEIEIEEWYEVSRGSLQRHLAASAGDELVFSLPVEGENELAISSNHPGLKVESVDGRRFARLAASKNIRRVSLIYGEVRASSGKTPEVPKGVAGSLGKSITTRIKEDRSGAGWVLDRIGLPSDAGWNRRVRPSDVVFLTETDAAVVTFEGDVWQVKIGRDQCRWRRIGAGLCEPLSIEEVDGVVQVFTRNGIIRLRDLNGDGVTDFYENHSSLVFQTAGTRGYPLDMEVDEKGQTWCSVGGIDTNSRTFTNSRPANPHSGSILKISADGDEIEIVSANAREPFFVRDPETGRIMMSDQQGNWVPSSGVYPVEAGSRFGYGELDEANLVTPAVWIPHDEDTSSSSPLWLRETAFKRWNGGLLDLSYGTGRILMVRPQGEWPFTQGSVIPLNIDTGLPILHARIHPGDGSIWFAGFRVYDSRAPELEGLARLRPGKGPQQVAIDAELVKEGVILHFEGRLEPGSIVPDSVKAKSWQYLRTAGYGSPRLKRDGQKGVDSVATGETYLSQDGKSVFVHIPNLAPTMQLQISHEFRIAGTKGEPQSVYFTVTDPPAAQWAELGFDELQLDDSVAGLHESGTDQAEPTVERGRELSARFGCIACHSINGAKEGHSGPTWKGVFGSARRFKNGESRTADEAYLIESILKPDKVIVEGYELGMGSYAGVLGEDEIASIVLYIKSLK